MSRVAKNTPNEFLAAVREVFGAGKSTISRQDVLIVCAKKGMNYPVWLTNDPAMRAERGLYKLQLPAGVAPEPVSQAPEAAAAVAMSPAQIIPFAQPVSVPDATSYVPQKAPGYVPFGHFKDVRTIVKSKRFYTMYITGLSGNGKTMMVEQVAAMEGRECIRANITKQTEEEDLLGGFQLVDGNTNWQNGAATIAMERGAILLLDEVDLGSEKLMCLQPVLEGKPVYLKKIDKVIYPAPGFTVVATANTKGKGSDDGRFIGTNTMNEALLDRFSITLEQEYPAMAVETKILQNVLQLVGLEDNDFVDKLVQWADVIRKSFREGAVSEIISTRRLVNICEAYAIFGQDRTKAITLCLNRFDDDTKTSFFDLYTKLDASTVPEANPTAEVVTEVVNTETF